MFLLGITLMIIGVAMIVKQSVIWLMIESWKSNGATEPTHLYIWSTRFGGIMMTLAGIGGIVANFL